MAAEMMDMDPAGVIELSLAMLSPDVASAPDCTCLIITEHHRRRFKQRPGGGFWFQFSRSGALMEVDQRRHLE